MSAQVTDQFLYTIQLEPIDFADLPEDAVEFGVTDAGQRHFIIRDENYARNLRNRIFLSKILPEFKKQSQITKLGPYKFDLPVFFTQDYKMVIPKQWFEILYFADKNNTMNQLISPINKMPAFLIGLAALFFSLLVFTSLGLT